MKQTILISGVVALVVSLIMTGIFVLPLYSYEAPPDKIYDASMRLRVDYYNETTKWLDFEMIETEIYVNITQRISIHHYDFRLNTVDKMVEPPVFSNVFIYFSIEPFAVDKFHRIELSWRIGDELSVVDDRYLMQSDDGTGFYIYYIDVSSRMWMDDVPDVIDGKISLYSRNNGI